MLHVGIVGCSAEGAALCYRTICTEAAQLLGPHAHPPVSMHTPNFAEYVRALDAGDRQAVADLMIDSALRLQASGADFCICPDNTIHEVYDLVVPHSPLPWLHIARVVAQEASRRGFRKVGVMGTHWLMASDVYPKALQARWIEHALPSPAQRERLGTIIMDELVPGIVREASVNELRATIDGLKAAGCDAVALACTELPLVLHDGNASVPTLDSTRLLARAAIARAIEGR
jgi:aspartate racemase